MAARALYRKSRYIIVRYGVDGGASDLDHGSLRGVAEGRSRSFCPLKGGGPRTRGISPYPGREIVLALGPAAPSYYSSAHHGSERIVRRASMHQPPRRRILGSPYTGSCMATSP
jgi:hypothetical protein